MIHKSGPSSTWPKKPFTFKRCATTGRSAGGIPRPEKRRRTRRQDHLAWHERGLRRSGNNGEITRPCQRQELCITAWSKPEMRPVYKGCGKSLIVKSFSQLRLAGSDLCITRCLVRASHRRQSRATMKCQAISACRFQSPVGAGQHCLNAHSGLKMSFLTRPCLD